MGYLASALPPLPDDVVVYLDCHAHGGALEMAEDVGKLADVLALLGGRRLIYASSAVLYDGVRTFYSLTKRTQEEMIRLAGVEAVVLRLGSIIGPAPVMRWDLLPNRFVWSAVREGRIPLTMPRAYRPLLGIHDAVRAVEWAATAPAGTYDIATRNMAVRDLAELVAAECDAEIVEPGEPPHVPSFQAQCVEAYRAGWRATDEIDDLVRQLRERARAEC